MCLKDHLSPVGNTATVHWRLSYLRCFKNAAKSKPTALAISFICRSRFKITSYLKELLVN